jgi:hypothetical protein
MDGFWDSIAVTAVAPLHIALQVDFELAGLVSAAGDAGESGVAAAGTELLGEIADLEEAGYEVVSRV